MNKKQKIVLWVGIITAVIMGIYPPWVYESRSGKTVPGPYGHIANPPPESYKTARFIDLYRLGVQWIMVAGVTGGLLVTLKGKRKE